ncbi:MAG TPA: hypothetical protein VF516_44905 [Kofleriaceae bacterium]
MTPSPNLPANVQGSLGDLAKPKMDASLAQANAKMTEAETKRDTDRSKAVSDAEAKVKQAHADADKQQQSKVADARTQIANHQADPMSQRSGLRCPGNRRRGGNRVLGGAFVTLEDTHVAPPAEAAPG